ncbi:MAG: hypothetical protein ACLP0J_28165 [Solirubrobacteraceae bacterium]|jgi:hypothetical protein
MMGWEREDLDALADATGEQRQVDRSEAEHDALLDVFFERDRVDFGYGPLRDRVADRALESPATFLGGDPAHRRASAA